MLSPTTRVNSFLKTSRRASTNFKPGRKPWDASARKSLCPGKALRRLTCGWKRSDFPGQLRNHLNFFGRFPGRRMGRLLYRSQRFSFVQCDREGDLRKRIDRVKINSRDLCRINVERDVADKMLGERRMLAAAPDRDCDIKPFTSFDGVRSNDFRRVLGIERFASLLELRSKLLCLSRPNRLRRQSTADELS